MAPTHAPNTESPTRSRSPLQDDVRQSSQDGSQYEMDLDALGLNSTFESTDMETIHPPPIDRVDTSEIEGPEDFTMNMTYWMTADIPPAQIKSRKEAASRRVKIREDAFQGLDAARRTQGEGDCVIVEDVASVTPTTRANGATDEHEQSTAATEQTMENDEKVRSFLSALPDTETGSALMGTPLRAPKHSFLQIPKSSPPKARSLQATVEDYDTPRKPTQGTMIHHTLAVVNDNSQYASQDQASDVQAQLDQQSLASRTRIMELETILAYTRTELESARSDKYEYKSTCASLEQRIERQQEVYDAARLSFERQAESKEEALVTKMQEFGEEMRLQNQAKLQNLRSDYEHRIQAMEEANRSVQHELQSKKETLEQVRGELMKTRSAQMAEGAHTKTTAVALDRLDLQENEELARKLATVQTRADHLYAQLEKLTAEAKASHANAQERDVLRVAAEAKTQDQQIRITALESHLEAARFELECAQADIAAKKQLFQTNLDLNTRLRTLQSVAETARLNAESAGQQASQTRALGARVLSLQSQLATTQADLASKDQQVLNNIHVQDQTEQQLNTAQGRVKGLESNVSALRQQLAEAHRESAEARTEFERCQGDLEDANDRLRDARAELDRRLADVEKKIGALKQSKSEAEQRLYEMQDQHATLSRNHQAQIEDVRDRADDAVRKVATMLEQERTEKKRLTKDLQRTHEQVAKLREAASQRDVEHDPSEDGDTQTASLPRANLIDAEIASLRTLVQRQVVELKTLQSASVALCKEVTTLKSIDSTCNHQPTILALQRQNAMLQCRLTEQEADFAAVNKAMDEKLAAMLNEVVKESAKTVLGKRDGQWNEAVERMGREREVMGKVLMRQWGREEVGIAEEGKQGFVYKYAERR